MTSSTQIKKTKAKKNIFGYVQLPIDDATRELIDSVKFENPLFSDLDCVRYILGQKIFENEKKKMELARKDFYNFREGLERVALNEGEKEEFIKDFPEFDGLV